MLFRSVSPGVAPSTAICSVPGCTVKRLVVGRVVAGAVDAGAVVAETVGVGDAPLPDEQATRATHSEAIRRGRRMGEESVIPRETRQNGARD